MCVCVCGCVCVLVCECLRDMWQLCVHLQTCVHDKFKHNELLSKRKFTEVLQKINDLCKIGY